MLIKEFFSELYKVSLTQELPVWELEFNAQNHDTLNELEVLFQFELKRQFAIKKKSEEVIPVVLLNFNQIIERKKEATSDSEREILNYFQLVWGLSVVIQLNLNGEFHYCFEIFMNSIYDEKFENGKEYKLSDLNIYSLLESDNDYISKTLIEQWFSELYYYSKSFSGLNEWCEIFFEDIYNELNDNLKIEAYHPQFLSNILSWCEVNFNSKASLAIRKIIEREYDLIDWSDFHKKQIKLELGLQLLLCNNFKNTSKKQLYDELCENEKLHPSYNLQAVVSLCYDKKSFEENLELLKKAVLELGKYVDLNFPDTIDSIYQRARLFKILLICVNHALEVRKGYIIDELLMLFYNIEFDEIGKIIYLIPNQQNRVAYGFSNDTIFDERDSQNIIIEINEIENKTFNTCRILKGGVGREVIPTDRPIGFSDSKYAEDFESKLNELYDFKLIEDKLDEEKSIIQFDFNSFPLQALMLKSIGNTLPLNLSLSKKKDFNEVNTVLFWSGFSYTSVIETEALEEIFSSKSIVFEIHNEDNSSSKKFAKRIKELKPDIVWISSHGKHNHYEPNSSKIFFSENDYIGVRDYELLLNEENNRRLLFLNVCEGGVHGQTGEFKNLGFPNLLTSNYQDVISHLWLAEPNFAFVFGVFIALGITYHDKNYFEAFKYSLSLTLSNKESILNELEEYPLELINLKERIRNNDRTEWGNIITTGSPVYHI